MQRLWAVALLIAGCWACSGRDEPACQLTIASADVDFGELHVGGSAARSIRIGNDGRGECRLSPEWLLNSSRAFSLQSHSDLIVGAQPVELEVRYRPLFETGRETATLRLGDREVVVRGRAALGPACYSDAACPGEVCARSPTIAPVYQWSESAELAWPSADVVAGWASVYNNHVELRLKFAETPFLPEHQHTLRICIDSDNDASTGTACGDGPLAGADTAFTYVDGELTEQGPIENPCDDNSYDAASRTIQFHVERYAFPNGNLEEQFRYVVLSSYVDEQGETVTDLVPDAPDFSRPGGSIESLHQMALWPSAEPCCRFRAGECGGGNCRPKAE